jgi:hypothetical protein
MEDTNMTAEWAARAWAKNPCAKLSNGDVRTGPVRLSFPHLLTLPKARGDIEPRYGASLLFPPGVDISVLRADAAATAKAKWPTLPRKLKSPFLDQTDDADRYAGFLEGGVLIRASANQKIQVVDKNLAPVIDEALIYPGVWAIVCVRSFAYDKGVNLGVSYGLQNVMLVADDTNIGGTAAANPREAFAGVSIEAGDIDAAKAFGEGAKPETAAADIFG